MRAARLFFLILGVFAAAVLIAAVILAWAEMDLCVNAPGSVEPAAEIFVVPDTSGVVRRVCKELFDSVAAGEPIAFLDDAAAREALTKARAALSAAQKKLAALRLERGRITERIRNLEIQLRDLPVLRAQARARLSAAEALLTRRKAELSAAEDALRQASVRGRNAREQADEYRQLFSSGFVTERRWKDADAAAKIAELEVEKARRRVEAASAEVRRAAAQRDEARFSLEALSETPLKAKISEARFDLKSAEADAAALQATIEQLNSDVRLRELDLEKYVIRAPVSGILQRLYLVEGQPVGTGVPPELDGAVASVFQPDKGFVFNADVSQRDIPRIKPGQKAEIILEAYPYRQYGTFSGRVVSLERRLDEPDIYTVCIRLAPPVYPLNPGMRGYSRIIVGRVRVLSYFLGGAEPAELRKLREKAQEMGSASYPALEEGDSPSSVEE